MITILCEKYDKSVSTLLDTLNRHQIPNCIISGSAQTLQSYLSSAITSSKAVILVGETYDMKVIIAQAFQLTMLYDTHAEKNIEKFCRSSKQPIPPQYLMDKLCALPENFHNYAPAYTMQCACYGEYNKCHLFVLPKDEREIGNVFNTYINKLLAGLLAPILSKVYKIFGLSKQEILDKVAPFTSNKHTTVYCDTDEYLDSRLTVVFYKPIATTIVNGVDQKILQIFDNFLYATKDISLQQEVVDTLQQVHKSVAVAESLTGGMITSAIVDIAGASRILYEGDVTYSIESKCRSLGLNPHFIDRYGVVSNQVAYQMAEAMIKRDGVDFAISTTGIAGPQSYNDQPVGLCYIGIASSRGINVYRNVFCGNREQIRRQATNSALFLLLQTLKTKTI